MKLRGGGVIAHDYRHAPSQAGRLGEIAWCFLHDRWEWQATGAAVMRERAELTEARATLALALWQMVAVDPDAPVGPEDAADRLLGLLERAGWTLERTS